MTKTNMNLTLAKASYDIMKKKQKEGVETVPIVEYLELLDWIISNYNFQARPVGIYLTERAFEKICVDIIKNFIDYKNKMRSNVLDPKLFESYSYEFEQIINTVFSRIVADNLMRTNIEGET